MKCRSPKRNKKTTDESQETVDVSKESEPEPAKKKTSSKRRVKKKVTLSADDNIIFDDPDTALELGNQTKVEEVEAASQVHATHARIMTESVLESAKKKSGGRNSKSVIIQDTPNIMKELKESKKISKRKPCTGGINEGTGIKSGVLVESTVIFATSSEGTGTKLEVPIEEKVITKENVIHEWGSEQESEHSEEDKFNDKEKEEKEGDADDEEDETESDEGDIYKYKIRIRKDEDEEMINVEVDDSNKGDEEITDAVKTDAEKTSESSSVLSVPIFVIFKPTVLTPVQESHSKATVTTLPPPSVSSTPLTPHQTTTPIPTPPTTTDAQMITITVFESTLAILKSQVPTVVESYLDSKVRDVFQKELQKHTTNLIQSYSLQHLPEITKKLTPTADQEEESKKIPLDILKIKKEQVEKLQMPKFTIKNPANHRLYHALMEAFIEDENASDKGITDTVKDHKRKYDDDEDDDDEDPLARPNHGKKTK
nr:hypothetical protein [Tanacetum cinerariifolium]